MMSCCAVANKDSFGGVLECIMGSGSLDWLTTAGRERVERLWVDIALVKGVFHEKKERECKDREIVLTDFRSENQCSTVNRTKVLKSGRRPRGRCNSDGGRDSLDNV